MALSTLITIRNETPRPLKLQGADDQSLDLAPLESRRLPADDLSRFDLSQARLTRMISDWPEPPRELAEKVIAFAVPLGVALGFLCAATADYVNQDSPRVRREVIWAVGVVIWLVGIGLAVTYQTKSFRVFLRFFLQMMSLLVILAIGLGLPAACVYYFGEGRRLLAEGSTELFTRLLQVGFIAMASLVPTLLFFLFDRYQLKTIRDRLYRDLFRLDRRLQKRSEIDAAYGSQIQETFGPEDEGRGRLAPGTRWPVLVCAVVVTAGWLAVFNPVGPVTPAAIVNPLIPRPTALAFGFMGAYFFGLQLIARRYSRADLKPKTYGYITIRILSVAVLSWILEVIVGAQSTTTLVLAFSTGILPEELFTFIREKLRGSSSAKLVPEPEKHPLTRLEGIDLYDRARLEQEGIVNIESLAHHELIRLVLETQVPVPRLVDWIDQAILYLHVTAEPISKSPPAGAILRQYGIRTSTDLLSCWDAAARGPEFDDFRALLGNDGKLYRLEVIRNALLDDEWLARIKDWRNDAAREELKIEARPNTFEGKLRYAGQLQSDGLYKDALRTFGEALEIRDAPEARLRMAQLLVSCPVPTLRDSSKARENARRAFDLGRSDLEILKGLIPIHEETDDTEYAIRATDAAIQLIGDPKDDMNRALLKKMKKKRDDLKLNRTSDEGKSQP